MGLPVATESMDLGRKSSDLDRMPAGGLGAMLLLSVSQNLSKMDLSQKKHTGIRFCFLVTQPTIQTANLLPVPLGLCPLVLEIQLGTNSL